MPFPNQINCLPIYHLIFYRLPSDPLKCLRNSPSGRQNKKDPLPPPGLIISADKQCKLMYNKKAYFVSNNNTVCMNFTYLHKLLSGKFGVV